MTGIALADLNIPKMAVGTTEIAKVSLGETLVWPSGSGGLPAGTYHAIAQIPALDFNPRTWRVTIPAGVTRIGLCVVGAGGDASAASQGAGGGGGSLTWVNTDVVEGDIFELFNFGFSTAYSVTRNGGTLISINVPVTPSGSVGAPGGTSSIATASIINGSWSSGQGGTGGNTAGTGNSAGGGGAGNYVGTAGATGGVGNGVGSVAGVVGTNGGGGSGGGRTGAGSGGRGGDTGVFGQGTNGTAGAIGGNGGNGSIPVGFETYVGGGGAAGRSSGAGLVAFAVRFNSPDYPAFVAPASLTVIPQT